MHVDKIDKDRRVLEAMGSIYCQGNHSDAQIRIRAIMRYAAPRMMVHHPIMALEYLRKKLRA